MRIFSAVILITLAFFSQSYAHERAGEHHKTPQHMDQHHGQQMHHDNMHRGNVPRGNVNVNGEGQGSGQTPVIIQQDSGYPPAPENANSGS